MNLVYFHQYFKFPSSSGGTRSYDLATSFQKRGVSVQIVTSSASLKDRTYNFTKGWNYFERDGLQLHVFNLEYNNKFSYRKRTFIFFKFIWASTFKIFSLKADIVLATSTPLTIGIPALLKKRFHKTPYVFEVRDVWPEAVIAVGAVKNKILRKMLLWLEKVIYINADAIIPLSTDMKLSITSRFSSLNIPIAVIENISQIDRFQNEVSKDTKFLENKIGYQPKFSILYAGTFGRVNGIQYIIELAKRLRRLKEDICFILLGDGVEKENLIRLAKQEDVFNKNVFFLDPIPKNKLPQIYSEVNMGSSFVLPIKELWANSANKFFDTLAAGKPVLINHEGWQSSTIKTENVGYVLPFKLENDFQLEEFVEYTRNHKKREVQGNLSLELAKKRFSLEVATAKYLSIFSRLGFKISQ